jgi:hypothetical protein
MSAIISNEIPWTALKRTRDRSGIPLACRSKRASHPVSHVELIERRHRDEVERHVLGWVYGAQELHELVTDLGRGFVLYPVAHIVEFETPDQTGKAGAELFEGWIERP